MFTLEFTYILLTLTCFVALVGMGYKVPGYKLFYYGWRMSSFWLGTLIYLFWSFFWPAWLVYVLFLIMQSIAKRSKKDEA